MDRPVERRIAPAAIGQHVILAEACARVVAVGLDHHVSAKREMMRHVAAVAID